MSPRGFGAVKEAAEKISRNTGEFQPTLLFKLPDNGDTGTVRFLEQGEDVYSYWYHDFSHVDKKNGWQTKVPCLDQDDEGTPCPGCRDDLPRKFQGLINLIWRDAPVFKRDEDNKVIKKGNDYVVESYEDQVAVWRSGIELFKQLANKDVSWKGLSTRDAQVTRNGLGLDTTYSIEPEDIDAGASKLSKADEELAKETYDLEAFAQFVDADEFDEIIEGYGGNSSDEDDDIKAFLKQKPHGDSEE
jgi:hypothetical protein